MAIGRAAHDLSRRGRAEAAADLVVRRWASWRGRAVEPAIRAALSLAAADLPWPEAIAVGGWWNRAFDPEIDLVGADRGPVAKKLWYVGSVTWLDHPFGRWDLAVLERGAPQVPGFDPIQTALISVSCSGFTESAATNLALCWLPEDIVAAFAWMESDRRQVADCVAAFAEDVSIRRYAEQANNIVHWSKFETGGHFAALQAPDVLVGDVRAFFASLKP